MTSEVKFASAALAAAAMLVGSGAVLLAPTPAAAQYTVYDPTAAANMAKQIAEASKQLSQLQQTYNQVVRQLEQAQQTHASLTGSRSSGQMDTRALRNYLPNQYRQVFDRALAGNYTGITGSVSQILAAEGLTGSVGEQATAMSARRRNLAATQRLTAEDAFAGAQARLEALDALQDRIAQTQDPKAIADLQARISIEQAAIANEATKLQLMRQMAEAEEKLAAEQRLQASRALRKGDGSSMARIR